MPYRHSTTLLQLGSSAARCMETQ